MINHKFNIEPLPVWNKPELDFDNMMIRATGLTYGKPAPRTVTIEDVRNDILSHTMRTVVKSLMQKDKTIAEMVEQNEHLDIDALIHHFEMIAVDYLQPTDDDLVFCDELGALGEYILHRMPIELAEEISKQSSQQ